eukprot:13044740-Ditylum_brightwellii.AAC.1
MQVSECKVCDQTEERRLVKVCTFKVRKVHPIKEIERQIMKCVTHLPCQGLQSNAAKNNKFRSKSIEDQRRHINLKELNTEQRE